MNRLPRWSLTSAVLALAGIGVAGYLTVVAYDQSLLVCGLGDCSTVQNSPYAKIAGVPIALLGLLMYLALFAVSLARWRWWRQADVLTSANAGIALAGTLYSGYLTYLELFVINAICQWCVASAVLVTALFLVESWGLRQVLREEPVSDRGVGSPPRAHRRQSVL
ncbi:vitamin K epoxide reductase family protein [Thermomicrobium sp. CFH 73360]|uniref:vitamin K epoxide reductase family protein n=1 Tax=Thermomicrobium sp. CFH 73360 TaxID=2951987 RepID=UPI0020778EE3|nr:vitamin K epoxide reductase family protein [Thermomicrobium sp. CFH 73360]MCM8747004.1 vitamin K epoxide reductase family protein [Thermomicrobium sp. CFH 73360]